MISSGKNSFCLCARAIAFLTLLLLGCGEAQMQRMFPWTVANVKGTWTGRLERVQVYDSKGNSYDAAALHIDSGPAPKEEYPGELKGLLGDGRVPVLASWNDPAYVVLDPSALPLGHRVKVSGVLFRYPLWRVPGGDVSRRMYLGWNQGGQEQILYVQGAMKAID
jgi:hypothetical protein